MPCLRRSVAGLSLRSPGFDPRPVYVRRVVHKVTVGPAFLQVLRFSPASAILPTLHTHFHLHDVNLQSEGRVAAICLLHTCRRQQARFTRIIWILLVQLIVSHTQWNTRYCYLLKNNGEQGATLLTEGGLKLVRVFGVLSCEDMGGNPRELFVMIIRNTEATINEFPLVSFPFLEWSARPCGPPTP